MGVGRHQRGWLPNTCLSCTATCAVLSRQPATQQHVASSMLSSAEAGGLTKGHRHKHAGGHEVWVPLRRPRVPAAAGQPAGQRCVAGRAGEGAVEQRQLPIQFQPPHPPSSHDIGRLNPPRPLQHCEPGAQRGGQDAGGPRQLSQDRQHCKEAGEEGRGRVGRGDWAGSQSRAGGPLQACLSQAGRASSKLTGHPAAQLASGRRQAATTGNRRTRGKDLEPQDEVDQDFYGRA